MRPSTKPKNERERQPAVALVSHAHHKALQKALQKAVTIPRLAPEQLHAMRARHALRQSLRHPHPRRQRHVWSSSHARRAC